MVSGEWPAVLRRLGVHRPLLVITDKKRHQKKMEPTNVAAGDGHRDKSASRGHIVVDAEDVAAGVKEAGQPAILINASGHRQELARSFSLVSLAGVGLTVGNVWPAIGGSILVAISNGGPPGVLYEFLAVAFFYFLVAASVAELVSAIPSSSGIYHFASVTPGPRWGRVVGFFAGWWNLLGYIMGAASMAAIFGNTIVQMYALNHADFTAEAWHVFVVYVLTVWLATALVCTANSVVPSLNNVGIFTILAGFFITVVAVAVMPSSHATSAFGWKEWRNELGYPDGFVFVAGMLNGAYSIGGAVDVITHLAEEIPAPERNVPIGMAAQLVVGLVTGFGYLVVLMYAIDDLDAVAGATYPIAEIYRQATGTAGATGLLALILVNIGLCVAGVVVTNGRILWTLARDGAVPFSACLGRVDEKRAVPVAATLAAAGLVTGLGCIYVGSTTAFNAFIGSAILFLSSSYLAALLPHLLMRRNNKNTITYGPFRMAGCVGYAVNGVACAYLGVWFVVYCFPYASPAAGGVAAGSMNYSSLIWGAFTLLAGVWWWVVSGAKGGYVGPRSTGGLATKMVPAEASLA